VLLPARNRKDFEEIPEEARNKLEFVWVDRIDDAVAAAFANGVAPDAAERPADERPPGGVYPS